MAQYIHELEDWPHFKWDPTVVLPLLAKVGYQQGLLQGTVQALGFSQQGLASLDALTLETVRTSEIEGDILDLASVRSSIAHRLNLNMGGFKPNTDKHIEGVVSMILDATQGYRLPLTAERLKHWQSLLFLNSKSIVRVHTGAWRNDEYGPMQVVSGPIGRERVHFEAPSADRLEKEMDAFIHWIAEEQNGDPVLKAAIAHLWFVTIHPFEDGNGRVGRAITEYLLARSENSALRFYSLSAQIRTEKNCYYDSLERTQKGSLDITVWLVWFLNCMLHVFEESQKTISLCVYKNHFWEDHANAPINVRQKLMINKLIDGFKGKLTTRKWGIICKCSHDTALRDIQGLLELGILQRDSAGGRSTCYSLKIAGDRSRSQDQLTKNSSPTL
ncbi:MAG: Fic family protein [Gammaproteobacteria bacterium]